MPSAAPASRWAKRLAGFDIPVPFDMTMLCAALADRRHRAIDFVPVGFGSTQISGLWVAGKHTDLIFYERDTTPLHQQHIQLHEIGHMLSDHPHATGPDTGWMAQLMPLLDVARLDALMARNGYDSDHEVDAEWFAREMGARARLVPRPRRPSPGLHDALARALRAFGRPW
jgi:hypothetical protein